METLNDHARRLDQAATRLASVAREITRTGPSPSAFGVDGPGRMADIGYALYEQWAVATSTRAREAEAVAARLGDAAGTLRIVAAGYVDADDAARRRHAEES